MSTRKDIQGTWLSIRIKKKRKIFANDLRMFLRLISNKVFFPLKYLEAWDEEIAIPWSSTLNEESSLVERCIVVYELLTLLS